MNATWIILVPLLAVTAIVGCEKTPEVRQDGQGSAPSGVASSAASTTAVAASPSLSSTSSPSSSSSALLVATAGSACIDGKLLAPPSPGNAGGTSMKGMSKITAGKIDVAASDGALCDAFLELHRCFNAVQKESSTLTGNALLTIVVAANGRVDSVTPSGPLGDAALSACATKAVKGLVLPKPEGGPATLEYAIDYTRSPGAGNVQLRETGVTIKGALPPEVVKRIVRANFPRFRACYENGKKTKPDLAGAVSVDFQIDMTGAVMATNLAAGGSLGDADVGKCVVGVFNTLSFPEPEQGAVKVHYGMVFDTW